MKSSSWSQCQSTPRASLDLLALEVTHANAKRLSWRIFEWSSRIASSGWALVIRSSVCMVRVSLLPTKRLELHASVTGGMTGLDVSTMYVYQKIS